MERKLTRISLITSCGIQILGIQIQESQKWDIHFRDLINALNYRLFQIRRISNHIPKEKS